MWQRDLTGKQFRPGSGIVMPENKQILFESSGNDAAIWLESGANNLEVEGRMLQPNFGVVIP